MQDLRSKNQKQNLINQFEILLSTHDFTPRDILSLKEEFKEFSDKLNTLVLIWEQEFPPDVNLYGYFNNLDLDDNYFTEKLFHNLVIYLSNTLSPNGNYRIEICNQLLQALKLDGDRKITPRKLIARLLEYWNEIFTLSFARIEQ